MEMRSSERELGDCIGLKEWGMGDIGGGEEEG